MIETEWGPGEGPAPAGQQAQAATPEPAVAEGIDRPALADQFFASATDAVESGAIPSDGWASGVSWPSLSCRQVRVTDLACPDCDSPPPLPPDDGIAWIQQGDWCTENTGAFLVEEARRWKGCPGTNLSTRIVQRSAGQAFAGRLQSQLDSLGTEGDDTAFLVSEGGPVVDVTAVPIVEAVAELLLRRGASFGPSWFTMSESLSANARDKRLLDRVGVRHLLADKPVVFDGVASTGPPVIAGIPSTTAGSGWLWIHGPVDYARGAVEDRSYIDYPSTSRFDRSRMMGLVRVDRSCGVFGMPVLVTQ